MDPCKWVTLLMLLVKHGADVNAYHEEGFVSERIRQSSLRYIKSRLGVFLRAEDLSLTSLDRHQDWYSGQVLCGIEDAEYDLPSDAEFSRHRQISDELIQLLTAKGAREEEWHETEVGTWTKVFPETPCLEPEDQHTAGGGNSPNAKTALAQERRSLLMRIRDRMHRLLSRIY
jgi:hypothetical protein